MIDYAKLANQSVANRRKQPRGVAVRLPKVVSGEKHSLFFKLLKREGLPLPVTEFQFARDAMNRRWAMDYCWRVERVFLEVDGGVFVKGDDGQFGGRHNRGAGWLADSVKLNAAASLGYRHLRCTPSQLHDLALIATIRETLNWKSA